jgi:hypothetical protein
MVRGRGGAAEVGAVGSGERGGGARNPSITNAGRVRTLTCSQTATDQHHGRQEGNHDGKSRQRDSKKQDAGIPLVHANSLAKAKEKGKPQGPVPRCNQPVVCSAQEPAPAQFGRKGCVGVRDCVSKEGGHPCTPSAESGPRTGCSCGVVCAAASEGAAIVGGRQQ